MSGTRVTLDGLWRCLCPAIDEIALSQALRNPVLSFSPLPCRTPQRRPAVCSAQSQWRSRPIHTSSRRSNLSAAEARSSSDNIPSEVFRQNSRKNAKGEDASVTVDALLQGGGRRELFDRAPTSIIYDALRIMQTQPKRRPHIRALVKYLVDHRAQTPNAFLYEALIASNWTTSGSAAEVRQILDEMRTLGVSATSSIYHAALRALAIHPDYLLRNRIIAEMKERWLEPDPSGKASIALGLLRDGQHELALDHLDSLLSSPVPPPPWVVDIFIVVLTNHTHLAEALSLLARHPTTPSPSLWSFLLDSLSRANHYPGTRLAWDALVPTRLAVPPDGVCLAVLNTASRHADAHLATDVVSHLSARHVRLAAHHYEALVDCYANRDDVANALHTLCIMARAGGAARPSQASAAPVFAAFGRNATLARVARDALLRLGETFTVPLPAFNVVLEGLCAFGGDEDAFELYQQIRHLCGCGPDAYTFRPFMETSWDVGVARFLVDEMQAFGVSPTREFYDRLVYVAAVEGDLDTSFWALGELEAKTGGVVRAEEWLRQETALAVVRRCVGERDERLWNLLWSARRAGLDLGPAGRALVESAVESKGKEEREKMGEDGGKDEREVPPWLTDGFFGENKVDGGVESG